MEIENLKNAIEIRNSVDEFNCALHTDEQRTVEVKVQKELRKMKMQKSWYNRQTQKERERGKSYHCLPQKQMDRAQTAEVRSNSRLQI